MARNLAEQPDKKSRPTNQDEERAALLADLEQMEPRTELGRKLIARRIEALKGGQELLDYDGIMREKYARRGGRSYE
jgi:hypothetical protein